MRAAILAGGKGTRISTLFPDIPKPMIQLMDKPVLQHQIECLVKQGIVDITLITGYKSEMISDYFGDGRAFGATVDYIIEETPLGTGGALPMLPREDTLLLLGDVFFDIDLNRFAQFHREKNALVTLFVHPNSHPYDSDIVVSDKDGKVLEWRSKKEPQGKDVRNLVNAGVYLFSKDALPAGGDKNVLKKRDLECDLILPVIQTGRVFSYRSTEYIKDMGTPDRFEAVAADMKSGMAQARNLENKQRAVFIDRDGTINEYCGLLTSSDQVHLIDKPSEAVRLLNKSPYLAICITNQPVIARGLVTQEGLNDIHARLDTLLGLDGAYLDDLRYCPHHPDKGYPEEVPEYKIDCDCRKPKPGLFLEVAQQYHIDLSRSFMIGDSSADIAAGQSAGCKSIGVRTGNGLSDGKYCAKPDMIFDDLFDAVVHIISEQENT